MGLLVEDGGWGFISRRTAQYYGGPFLATADSDLCLIRASDGTGAWRYYLAIDTSYHLGTLLDSSAFERGNIGLHFSNLPSYDGQYFLVGGLEVDTIGKWDCWPLSRGYFSSGSGTNVIIANRNIYLYRYDLDKGGSSADDAYQYMVIYHNRLFWKTQGEQNYIHWSEKYDMDSTAESWKMPTETHDGDWITGLKVQGDYLNVYKNNSILQAYPTNVAFNNQQAYSEFFDFRVVTNVIGCIAPRSLVEAEGIHYFLSNKGFIAFDGANYKIISDPIRNWIEDSIDLTYLSIITSVYYKDNILWSVPTMGSHNRNNRTLVYNIPTGAWTFWNFGSEAFIVSGRGEDTTHLFISLPDSGMIGTYGGDNDFGDSIDATLQTDYLDFNLPDKYKFSKEILLDYNWSTSRKASLAIYSDFESTINWADTMTTIGSFGQFRVPCGQGAYGRNLSLELKLYNASGARIPFIKWLVKTMGGAR